MGLYSKFLVSMKELKSNLSKDPTTMNNVSGAIAAEFLVFVSLILAALFLRHVSLVASIVVVLLVAILFFTNMPLAGKIKSEQSDSLEKMTFYVIITLGILIAVIYWGLKYV
ncbi:energy-converting hydrogenase B subunit G EhbG [Methanobrevibacter sp.]|uniref:energy-converting hydrogenase B subunit G EhbG n=1 Tax=Methanobrevibacter sp. TaxID=66852 RepID=UPI0025DBB5FB|nr:energy-converting hydrogenase B subunit G EhbG [Methanobrevibacter sp.]MBQ2962440.1 energy-converting hydrogenase B subunit G EhbG [Methanobrevibacter sp.]